MNKHLNKSPTSIIQYAFPRGSVGTSTLGLLVRHGSGCVPSNGGLILFGYEDIRKRYFPDARVSCVRFLTTDKTEFLDRQDIPSLLDAVVDVPRFIARNTRLASKTEGREHGAWSCIMHKGS